MKELFFYSCNVTIKSVSKWYQIFSVLSIQTTVTFLSNESLLVVGDKFKDEDNNYFKVERTGKLISGEDTYDLIEAVVCEPFAFGANTKGLTFNQRSNKYTYVKH